MSTAPRHRLLFLIGQLSGGGYERQLWYMLRGMDRTRLRPGVIVWDRREEEPYREKITQLDVPVYELASKGYVGRVLELRQLVGRLRPEVLHSWSFYTGLFAWAAMLGRRGLVVSNIRSDYATERKRVGPLLGTLAAVLPQALLANNRVACEATQQSTWPKPRNVAFLPNAVDLNAFDPQPPSPSERLEIIGIGRLSAEKNWAMALRAVNQLNQDGFTQWRLSLVGSGPAEAELRSLADELGIAEQVTLLGFCDDVPELLRQAHVAVLTSRYEGSPNAALEAMAAARPLIATPAGDLPRMIEEGVSGWLVPLDDHLAVTNRLRYVAEHPEQAAEIGQRARESLAQTHGEAAVIAELLRIYAELGWRP